MELWKIWFLNAVFVLPVIFIKSNHYRHQNSSNALRRMTRAYVDDSCSGPYYFRCISGACIEASRTCDGAPDCPDGSDEMLYLCRRIRCPKYTFRCTYGACVDQSAVCDGVRDCADHSDELQPRCSHRGNVKGNSFICDNGEQIDAGLRCDGVVHCADVSDETIRACADFSCPHHKFQCAYGGCVNASAECDGVVDCADGSDETDLLCRRERPRISTADTTSTTKQFMCEIPEHPQHGRFWTNYPQRLAPGMRVAVLYLNATCEPGYKLVGEPALFCFYGLWSQDRLPTCVPGCKVEPSPSVEYRCFNTKYLNTDDTRDCEALEPEGSIMRPECRPNYYSPGDLSLMYCEGNGQWDHEPECLPGYGTTPANAVSLEAEEHQPWHASLYWLDGAGRRRVCSAALVAADAVVTAAHCLWDEKAKRPHPASRFAVAAGTPDPRWSHPHDDAHTQTSDVKEMYLAHDFYGATMNYEGDLAVAFVGTPFVLGPEVGTVYLDLSGDAGAWLWSGDVGTVASWGPEGDELRVLQVPTFPHDECVRRAPPEYAEFLTGGKICAAHGDGPALCKGDSGSGVTFPMEVDGETIDVLRAIVSAGPSNLSGQCNTHSVTALEPISKHDKFIESVLSLNSP